VCLGVFVGDVTDADRAGLGRFSPERAVEFGVEFVCQLRFGITVAFGEP